MATQQAISTTPFETALALADCETNDFLTSNLGAKLARFPIYQNFIRECISAEWPNDFQSVDEIGIVMGVGTLVAAGIIYGQLFGGMASPLMIALATPEQVVE